VDVTKKDRKHLTSEHLVLLPHGMALFSTIHPVRIADGALAATLLFDAEKVVRETFSML
jgi:hypothetical protein